MMLPKAAIDLATLEAARAGDPAAHALLYERFAPMVFTVARRLLASTSIAEDVLQDTFVEVIRGIAAFREEAAIAGWIKRIAVNKALSQLRSGWWSRRADGDPEVLGDPCRANAAEVELELVRLLESLPGTTRAVVWLHDAEGYTHAEIAKLMGRSVSFSKTQLSRAHERLRARRDQEYVEAVEPICTNAMKIC